MDRSKGRRKSRRLSPLMIMVGAAILLVCAVVPWLIPWDSFRQPDAAPPAQGVPGEIAPEPSTAPSGGASEEPKGPTAADVKKLSDKVKGAASAGVDLPVDPSEVSNVQTDPGEYHELGSLSIPSIGLDPVTFAEGVYGEPLERGPGHWPGTPMPGSKGNSVISGHRNTHTQPFKELDRVVEGDTIETSMSGKTSTFKVIETAIIPEDEYKEFVLKQPEDQDARQVTLFACHPEGNPIFRIIVRAERIE